MHARRARMRGFTLLEMVVVVILIALLMTLAIDRMIGLQAVAERVAMDQVLGGLRSALTLQLAQRIAQGRTGEIPALARANPVHWLVRPPGNYAGAFPHPDPARIQGGRWYFNTSRRWLVYRIAHAADFHTPLPGPPRVRFKVSLLHADNPSDDAPGGDVVGIRLAPLEPFHWVRPVGAGG